MKCQLTTEKVASCSECLRTGAQCTLEPPEIESKSPLNSLLDQERRLGRVEQMLRKLTEAQEAQHPPSWENTSLPEMNWEDFLNPDLFPDSLVQEPFPDTELLGTPSLQAGDESTKQVLLNLLPSPEDITKIGKHTGAWALELQSPPGVIWKLEDPSPFRDPTAAAQFKTLSIAKTMLLLALDMQQLPPDFDLAQLQMMRNASDQARLYTQVVTSLILVNEEMTCSTEGLECLLLLGMIHINDGMLQKAWMTFRRALDVARLHGFHKSYTPPARKSESQELALHRRFWLSANLGDSFCSLLLGLELGGGSQPFGEDYAWDDPSVDETANFQRRLCILSAQLSQRNSLEMYQNFDETRSLNEALDTLYRGMPDTWWEKPIVQREHTLRSAQEYSRLLCHLWFFLLRILTNIPFFFERGEEAEKWHVQCLEAARTTLYRYLGLHLSGTTQLHTKGADIVAFVSSLVVLLSVSQDNPTEAQGPSHPRSSDMALVEQIVDSCAILGRSSSREHIAIRSAEILSALCNKIKTKDFGEKGTAIIAQSAGNTNRASLHEILAATLRRPLREHPASNLLHIQDFIKPPAAQMPVS